MTTELARTQRRMQALITDPHDSDPQAGGDLVCETTALGAADRVALYRRAYHLRLVSCLREIHPALHHALTPELFDAFALEYLAERPSRSYTLTTLAAGWPEHLQATRPDRGAQASRRERWPDFLVDLARLERTFHEVYDAPGAEDLKLPCADDLPAAPDGGWLAATVEPVACLRLARARYPVGAYMLAVRRGEEPPLPAPAPTHVAVSRRDYVVTLTELDAAGYALLRELTGGASVAAAAGGAGLPAAAAWALLRGWADRGFFSAIVVPQAVVQTTRGKDPMTLQSTFPVNAQQPIETVEQLRNHLHQAAAVELSTVPLYLYAAYSIKTQSYSQWGPGMSAFRTIRSVVIEEMLHLCLARNLLVAIGGGDQIRFYEKDFIPTYPSPMLHRVPDLMLGLERCTPALMQDVFMPLEMPAKAGAPAQPDSYNTLGQFYAAITDGFERLSGPKLWRNPHVDLQYDEAYWNQDGGGKPIVVIDLLTAQQAIATIVEQGEGAGACDDEVPLTPAAPKLGLVELSHYAKFRQIAEGIDGIGDTWPVVSNPKREDFQGPVRELATLFDAAYCYVLCMIDAVYRTSTKTRTPGSHSPRYGLERTFIAAMGGLLFPIGDLLVRQPGAARGTNAAPPFGYFQFDEPQPGKKDPSKKDQLMALCTALIADFPSLGGDDGVQALIARLPSV